jgi:hypothetical protein
MADSLRPTHYFRTSFITILAEYKFFSSVLWYLLFTSLNSRYHPSGNRVPTVVCSAYAAPPRKSSCRHIAASLRNCAARPHVQYIGHQTLDKKPSELALRCTATISWFCFCGIVSLEKPFSAVLNRLSPFNCLQPLSVAFIAPTDKKL